MDISLAREIIAILPDDRTLFRYHEDRYAFMLLEYAIGDGAKVSAVKRSRFARLLARPKVKAVLAEKGDGVITCDDFARAWSIETQNYVLTLGVWGSGKSSERDWHQTSRTGVNLVVQLNFDRGHVAECNRLLAKHGLNDFSYYGHPVSEKGRKTLAWARIDLDLDTGEALIEEVQNDWVRNALRALDNVKQHCQPDNDAYRRINAYVNERLKPHAATWSEAVLSAALFFLIEEIGIRRIWHHDFETGNRLKKLEWSKPPRSLYTVLPKRFCFAKTSAAPEFLIPCVSRYLRKRLTTGKEKFWLLDLEENRLLH